jgi:hypothetical protein
MSSGLADAAAAACRDADSWRGCGRAYDIKVTDQAAAMAEASSRSARMLKALRDLRPQTPGLVMLNAGQVNVGEQANVAGER